MIAVITFSQLEEARRALDAPLFADVGGEAEVSFEFFPPQDPLAHANMWTAVERLAPLRPRFVSVTYGAGGGTRDHSCASVARIQREAGLAAAAHLTCVGASRAEVDAMAEEFWAAGIRHIVALRGDGPAVGAAFTPHPQGYAGAADLVEGLRRLRPFEISVAAYPERHPDSPDLAGDLDNLRRKLDAGAARALTQFFFEPEIFFRFRDAAAAASISAELVPGILPVSNFAQTKRFAAACGASIPSWMARLFEGLDDHPGTRQLVAATIAAEQCRKLYAGGVRSFHFYTLNRAELSFAICHLLGVRVRPIERAEAA